jgi:hypothetical protein
MSAYQLSPCVLRDFVRQHKVVTQAARCRVPCVVAFIVGAPVRGSWWGLPQSNRIFNALNRLGDAADLAVCRAVQGRLTYVDALAWPALWRLADRLPHDALARVVEVHGDDGRHRTHTIPPAAWLPADVKARAAAMSEDEAVRDLCTGVPDAEALRRDLGLAH